MKCQIARGVRVFITKEEYQFVQDIKGQTPFLLHSANWCYFVCTAFLLHNLPIEQRHIAQRLGDKAVFVRKKLATTTQYNFNKKIRFIK